MWLKPSLSLKKYTINPFCTSDFCLRKNFFWLDKTYRGAFKDVPKGTDECPDCHHFLFWRKTEIGE